MAERMQWILPVATGTNLKEIIMAKQSLHESSGCVTDGYFKLHFLTSV